MKGIMIQGCTSDAGKSYIATALCRIFADMGYKTCPYKSQNMSNNSYVTWDGGEIGRAQGVQAEAAGIRPETYMNPILLKPQKDCGSEIVLFGQVHKTLPGKDYHENFTLTKGLEAAKKGLKIIEDNYDVIVIEGAGSPAEVNLNDREIVNMRIAREANVPVILVVDINKGGSFASVVGTLELVGKDREMIKGIIFNKFRGDISLFEDGVKWIEEYTGVKVVGVLPYFKDIQIEGEDSLSIKFQHASTSANSLNLGIVRLPYISNHTDMEVFQYEEDVNIDFIDEFSSLDKYDGIIIPGTKSTIGDLEYLEERGIAEKLRNFSGAIFGICGGYQIMGETLIDEEGVDYKPGYKKAALGLLPLTTYFQKQKEVGQVNACGLHPAVKDMAVQGYEIHLGRTDKKDDSVKPLWIIDGRWDGVATDDFQRAGSYLHNIFHNDNFRNFWLNNIRRLKGLPQREVVDTVAYKESQYKKLAAYTKEHLDMEYIMELLEEGVK